jgi:hypothetical protein
VCGNRYSVPDTLVGEMVIVRIGLEGTLRVYNPKDAELDKQPVAVHHLRSNQEGWVTVPEHHANLWREATQVEQRPLQAYEEAAQWN